MSSLGRSGSMRSIQPHKKLIIHENFFFFPFLTDIFCLLRSGSGFPIRIHPDTKHGFKGSHCEIFNLYVELTSKFRDIFLFFIQFWVSGTRMLRRRTPWAAATAGSRTRASDAPSVTPSASRSSTATRPAKRSATRKRRQVFSKASSFVAERFCSLFLYVQVGVAVVNNYLLTYDSYRKSG